jgi:hypothetical protein
MRSGFQCEIEPPVRQRESRFSFPNLLILDSRCSSTYGAPFQFIAATRLFQRCGATAFLVRSRPAGAARASVPPEWIVFPVRQEPVRLISFFHPNSAPSIGHGFGGIPAPCSFGSSAFPFPPKNSSQTTSKSFCVPPEMQTLALGADPSRYTSAPVTRRNSISTFYLMPKLLASRSWFPLSITMTPSRTSSAQRERSHLCTR